MASAELRKALHIVDDWAKRWRHTFNPNKCTAICFLGPRVYIVQEFQTTLQVGSLSMVGAIWYLEVGFDANLPWHKHIREAVAGAKGSMWAMRLVVGKRWGAAPSVCGAST